MYLKKVLLVFFLILFGLSNVKSQIPQDDNQALVSIGIGYFGELLTHSGFVLFVDFNLYGSKDQFLIRTNVLYYKHKKHTVNLALLPELVYRMNTTNRAFWEFTLGVGGLYQKADAKVFEYSLGTFQQKKKGSLFFMPSAGIRYGRGILLNNDNLIMPSIGGRLFYQYPFNDFLLPRVAFDLSSSYQLK